MARTRLYRDGELVASDFALSEVGAHVDDPRSLLWIDLCEPGHAELRELADQMHLHDLAVEDAVDRHQRPKLDAYETHLFITAYAVRLDRETGELATSEVSIFVTHNAMVTVRADTHLDMAHVLHRWDNESHLLATHGPAFLLHGLLDHIVDTQFEAVTALDEEIESLEDLLFAPGPPDPSVQRRSFELRKSLVRLRRDVLPMREVINRLLRRDVDLIDETTRPFFEDIYDHVLRASEWTESLRDLVSTILETTLTIQGNRLNMIMKKLTGWAAIIAVPTAITGYFGQNVTFPFYDTYGGFVVSSATIAAVSAMLYVTFRRRDWM